MSCGETTFQITYVDVDTPVGPDIVGPTITFGGSKPSCLMMFVTFAPTSEGNSLTISMSVWDDTTEGFMVINGVSNLVITDTGAQVVSIPGAPHKIKFTFTSTQTTDEIGVGISGLPIGYSVS